MRPISHSDYPSHAVSLPLTCRRLPASNRRRPLHISLSPSSLSTAHTALPSPRACPCTPRRRARPAPCIQAVPPGCSRPDRPCTSRHRAARNRHAWSRHCPAPSRRPREPSSRPSRAPTPTRHAQSRLVQPRHQAPGRSRDSFFSALTEFSVSVSLPHYLHSSSMNAIDGAADRSLPPLGVSFSPSAL